MATDEWSCLSGRSVVGFQNLPRQVGRVFTCQECNGCKCLPVGSGWLDAYQKYMKLQPGEFYAAGMDKLPRIPFDREQGIIDLAQQMAVA